MVARSRTGLGHARREVTLRLIQCVQALVAVLGVLLARRTSKHWPVAVLLAAGFLLDVSIELLGEHAWAFRVVLGTVYPWTVVAVTTSVLGRSHSGLVLALFSIYIGAVLGSGARGAQLAAVYAVAQAGLAVALIMIVGVWWLPQKHPPSSPTEACAIICAAGEIANVPPYLGLPGSWWSARAAYCTVFLTLCIIQGRWLLCSRPATRSGARSSF